ncbi:hypothetical protein HU230_0026155 [Bradyrhizobium quebecense]|uniref:hypothetical protein n=1 Tax=Bradyrhizobium quebecense TaxID=2748629 RepID=UPI001CD1BD92|nr:hypothetical protein [Bradyrhizobium quebecense]UGA41837.1 hypothetical protein HU230_0026155 [Bradyrhizobium quebecense]
MSRDAKSLTSTLVLFYAIGAVLALGAYALYSIDDLAVVLTGSGKRQRSPSSALVMASTT